MDIVERLRRLPRDYRIALYSEGEKDCMEAADEIERLREALREIGDNLTPDKYDNEVCLETHCGEIARAALKEGE